MATTSSRMLELLALLQARARWSGDELAQRLHVSTRTVRRDITSLRDLGYSVDVELGPGGMYRLGKGTTLPPLILDDKQAVAIAIALQTAPNSVMGLGDAAAAALTNVRRLLPTRLAPHIDALKFTNIRNYWELMAPPIDSDVLMTLGRAQASSEIVRVSFAPWPDSDDGSDTRARLEPHHLVVWSSRWYIVGFDLELADWRVIRVDRIRTLRETRLGFEKRAVPGDDVVGFVQRQNDRNDAPDHWPCVGELTIRLPATVVARWAPGGAVVTALGDDRCTLTLGAWSWVGLAALAGTFDAEFERVSPRELREACATLADRYGRVAQGATQGLDAAS